MDYEIEGSEPPSTAVVRVVGAVTGREPGTLPPLDHVVDPDALDALSTARTDGEPRTGARLEFVYAHCRVTVENGEYVTVDPLDPFGGNEIP